MEGEQLAFPFYADMDRRSKILKAIKDYQGKGKEPKPRSAYHGKSRVNFSCFHHTDID